MLRVQTSFQDTPGDGFLFAFCSTTNVRSSNRSRRSGCEIVTQSFCGSQTVGTSQLRLFSFLTLSTL